MTTTHSPGARPGEAGHERFEVLLVKAVDGALSAGEREALDAHLQGCAACREELRDFVVLKETTDAMAARILADAAVEPPRPGRGGRAVQGLGWLLLLAGVLVLLGMGLCEVFGDPGVPLLVKTAVATAGSGALVLFVYLLRLRLRAAGRDPYEEVDR